MDGFLRRTSLLLQKQSARGTRFSPCSDKDNVSRPLEGHLVKKEAARHMSMEWTECFENLKATPSVPGTRTCHPLPLNTGSPLGKAPSQSWPSLRLRRRPWDALLALGCSATRTPGIWEGSSLGRAVTCDMGRDLAQTPPASKSQASAQRRGAARTRRGGRVSPACSQTRGALPDSQLPVFLSWTLFTDTVLTFLLGPWPRCGHEA